MDAVAKITQQRLKEVAHYDPETGRFTALVRRHRIAVGAELGTVSGGRRKVMIDYGNYKAHRLAWLYVHGEWPKSDIDHIDGNPLNNAIANLRDVSRAVNMQNVKRARSDSSSGCIGAMKSGRQFVAEIMKDGNRQSLGRFATAAEASTAYIAAKRTIHADGCTI